ncbi:MAG: serine hydroxymethyltransferase [Planctomycetota bacterium]|jgi:glycine hydroxymethyltransferase
MLLNKDKSGDTSRVLKASRKDVYEFATGQDSKEYHEQILAALRDDDPLIYELIVKEYERTRNSLQLIAAENQCSQAVLAALGSVIQNKTTEGFPGSRFHGGSEVVDDVERLAAGRAREAFDAKYANVQPHSGTQANQIVLTAVLERGEKILSLGLDQGGHLSHGAKFSFSGKFFDIENYYVEPDSFLLDYQAIRKKALQFRPKLIICGATAYARAIDFKKFRQIADEVGAYLLADISHISGLVIAGAHPSPVNYAHFTTTSTYKPGGPRGGLILMGKDYDSPACIGGAKQMPLRKHIEKTTFPGVQGTPYLNNIAAKAVFFRETLTEEYRIRQFKIIENAKRLAESLLNLGFDVLTGGTDNHMVLINVANFRDGLTGHIAQQSLEDCGIIINKNKLPYDTRNAMITSGIRLGTPIVTKRGMGQAQMDCIAEMIDSVLRQIQIHSESQYDIDKSFKAQMTEKVKTLCNSYAVM